MRLLIAGDTHASLGHVGFLLREAQRLDVDRIVQLGDWGFTFHGWDRYKALAGMLEAADVPMSFLDGNHDNFTLLAEVGASPDGAAPVALSPWLEYLPRGSVVEWDGQRFMAFGGAVSIDKDHRVPGVSWWPEETITEAQVRRVEDSPQRVDVLLAHDCPDGCRELADYLDYTSRRYGIPYKADRESAASRRQLRRVLDATSPSVVYHGHYHHRYSGSVNGARIVGIDCDGSGPDSYVIHDTESA